VLYCPECGKQVSLTAKFCKECGYNLKADLGDIAVTNDSKAAPVSNDAPDSQSKVHIPRSLKCHFHPERDSTSTCANCNKGLCPYCKTIVESTVYCPDCVEEVPKTHFQEVCISSASRKTRLRRKARNGILTSCFIFILSGIPLYLYILWHANYLSMIWFIICLLGTALWVMGWSNYISSKGRSQSWGLLSLISALLCMVLLNLIGRQVVTIPRWSILLSSISLVCIGPIILMLMKDKPLKDIELRVAQSQEARSQSINSGKVLIFKPQTMATGNARCAFCRVEAILL
jgi:hypothetical protein